MYKNINDMSYRIFVINPGSTSTKLAYFEDENKLYEANVFHDASELAKFDSAYDQLDFRKQMILEFLDENGIDLHGVDAIVGRGGSTAPINGGVYAVNDKLLEDTRNKVTGVDHPANLGAPLARELAAEYGGIALMVDGPKVDEFIDEARITGIDGFYRGSSLHVLNLRLTEGEIAAASEKVGKILTAAAAPQSTVLRAALMVEEVFMAVKDRNGARSVRAEVTLDLNGDEAVLILRDDGEVFNITDADARITSLRTFLVASVMEFQPKRMNLTTIGYNRNIFKFERAVGK